MITLNERETFELWHLREMQHASEKYFINSSQSLCEKDEVCATTSVEDLPGDSSYLKRLHSSNIQLVNSAKFLKSDSRFTRLNSQKTSVPRSKVAVISDIHTYGSTNARTK